MMQLNAQINILQNMPVGVVLLELQKNGTLCPCYMNDEAYKIMGLVPNAFEQGESDFSGVEEFVYGYASAEMKKALEEGSCPEKISVIQVDGIERYIRSITKPIQTDADKMLCYTVLMDVSEQVRAEQRVQWQTAQYHMLAELPGAVIFDYEPVCDVMTLCVNMPGKGATVSRLERYRAEKNYCTRAYAEHVEQIEAELCGALHEAKSGVLKYQANYYGKGYDWVRVHYISLANERGIVHRIVGRIDNIEDAVRRENALWHLAQQDSMTGLLNRVATQRAVENYLRSGSKGALFVIDIDEFKRANDTLGHLFGDSFIKEVALVVRKLFREEDVVGRIGGDEFAIFMVGSVGQSVLKAKAKNILRVVEDIPVPGIGSVKCSVGVAESEPGEMGFNALFKRADNALYAAKQNGRARYAVYGEKVEWRNAQRDGQKQAKAYNTGWAKTLAADVFDILYHAEETEEGINRVFEHIGRWLDVSRVYVFESVHGDAFTRNTFEWVNDGVSKEIGNLQLISYRNEDGTDYRSNFDQDGTFYCRDVGKLPQWQYELLRAQGVKSLLQQAVVWDGCIRGFIGFDECRENRFWTKEQVNTLIRMAEMISLFLWKLRDKEGEAANTREQ